jgi:hypothetical protein
MLLPPFAMNDADGPLNVRVGSPDVGHDGGLALLQAVRGGGTVPLIVTCTDNDSFPLIP